MFLQRLRTSISGCSQERALASVEAQCHQHCPGPLEGRHGSHHFNWGTSKEKIFEETTPFAERELRKLCHALEGRGCVILGWPLVVSELAHIPKGPGQEWRACPLQNRGNPLRSQSCDPDPLYSRHACNREGLVKQHRTLSAGSGSPRPLWTQPPAPGDGKGGCGDPLPGCPSSVCLRGCR